MSQTTYTYSVYSARFESKTQLKFKMHYTANNYSFAMRNDHTLQANILWRIFILIRHISARLTHTVQRLMLSKGAKWTIFCHIKVILQYFWDKTIARSGDMYRDDSGIFSLVIKCFGITNTSVQNFATRISSVKTVPKCVRKQKVFWINLI